MRNELISKSLQTAAVYNRGENRKGKDVPYIVHPVEVAMILMESRCKEELVAAGLLHDILEDTGLTEENLRSMFSNRVVELVIGASEELEKRDQTPWKDRKEHTIEYLKNAERDIQILSCADKLSNARSMLRDYNQVGDKLWDRFNRGYEQQKWYYTELTESLKDLEEIEIYREFKSIVERLFQS